jgi:hypothetical protein
VSRNCLLALTFVSTWVGGCSSRTTHHDLIGKEVTVFAEPTIITTSTTSQVQENTFKGKLLSVSDDWVVVEDKPGMSAINRDKVVSIVGANAEFPEK